MRKRSIAWLAGAGAAVVTFGVGVALPASAAELLTNPGFETGTLSGWRCDASDSVGGTPHTGAKALLGNAGADTARCEQTVSVQPNTAYTFSGFVNGSYVFIGATGGTDASTWTPGTGGAYASCRSRSPPAPPRPRRSSTSTAGMRQGAYTADDFSLSGPGGTPTSGPPTTSAPPTSRPPSSPPPTSPPPTSPPPTSPPPTSPPPTNPPSGPLPKHFLTGYWQDFVNPAAKLKLRDVPADYDLVAVAFADGRLGARVDHLLGRPATGQCGRRLQRRGLPRRHRDAALARQARRALGRRRDRHGQRRRRRPPRPTSPPAPSR